MTATLAQAPSVPPRPVTLRPAPRREPPFDDERGETTNHLVGFEPRLPFELVRPPTPLWRTPPRSRDGLPDPARWSRRLLLGMVETAGGRRPLHQLAAFLSPSVHHGLTREFERSNLRGAPHWLCRAAVRTVHASEPREGVAELCAVLDTGERAHAVAMRLERSHGRWRCIRLQLG